MLANILLKLKEQKGPASLLALSEELNISLEMLEQMLGTLVRQGKLKLVDSLPTEDCANCDDCPIINNCEASLMYKEKQYRITEE